MWPVSTNISARSEIRNEGRKGERNQKRKRERILLAFFSPLPSSLSPVFLGPFNLVPQHPLHSLSFGPLPRLYFTFFHQKKHGETRDENGTRTAVRPSVRCPGPLSRVSAALRRSMRRQRSLQEGDDARRCGCRIPTSIGGPLLPPFRPLGQRCRRGKSIWVVEESPSPSLFSPWVCVGLRRSNFRLWNTRVELGNLEHGTRNRYCVSEEARRHPHIFAREKGRKGKR